MSRVLKVRDLKRYYTVREGGGLFPAARVLKAVDGVSFDVAPGQTLGIVGESGCGKSTTARMLLGHIPASSGEIWFGEDRVTAHQDTKWRQMRRIMQMIYQDPLGALDRRLKVSYQIEEPLIIHHPELTPAERQEKVASVMADVGLLAHHGDRYPHELSGGQRQRVIIARALSLEPELLVCDEPVSALDVSVQAQVLNVFEDIRARTGFTAVFISHDLKVIRQIADRVAVMYLGRIVELGDPEQVFHAPAHPYTKALVSAVPSRMRRSRDRIILPGDPPSPLDAPSGCPFHTRCREAIATCRTLRPEMIEQGGRTVACHLVNNPSLAAVA